MESRFWSWGFGFRITGFIPRVFQQLESACTHPFRASNFKCQAPNKPLNGPLLLNISRQKNFSKKLIRSPSLKASDEALWNPISWRLQGCQEAADQKCRCHAGLHRRGACRVEGTHNVIEVLNEFGYTSVPRVSACPRFPPLPKGDIPQCKHMYKYPPTCTKHSAGAPNKHPNTRIRIWGP